MIRALAVAALLAGCGVKAPPRPPLGPGATAPDRPEAAEPDAGERAAAEPAAAGACATPPSTPKTP